jgi:hypothetical protein
LKTVTITYHNAINYGAVLQTYALQQVQLNMSIQNEIIDYCPKKVRYRSVKVHIFKSIVIYTIRVFLLLFHIFHKRKQKKIFKQFIKNTLILTRKYKDLKTLQASPPKAEIYIAGSDQLWNVSISLKRAFFLDFGDDRVKRISYAVSMGNCPDAEAYKDQMYELLMRFDSVSVREKTAQEYLENLLDHNRPIHVHFDPVFLLSREEWLTFAKERRMKSPYILCIPLGGHPFLNQSLQKLKKLTGYQTVIIDTEVFTRMKGDVRLWDVTPREFVYLIHKAEYILTASFHGTAFSTLLNKKFFSFVGNPAPGRITCLLERLGLKHRIIRSIEDINTQEIDYTMCNCIIEREKALAIEYLQSLL